MQALFHSLNIGTLATWLSVAGFGTVGVIVHDPHLESAVTVTAEALLPDADFILGDDSPPTPEGETVETLPTEINPVSLAETLHAPPELPTLAEIAPLPEIPELPAIAPKPVETISASAIQPTTRTSAIKPATRSTPTKPARATSRKTASGGPSGTGTPGTGSSSSSRLAAGRMPPPSYPPEARRKGQSGTVVVEFTVDASGRVISAYAQSPSPWPLLNNEAVRTVRRWKFPSGGIMKLQRPIVFQLR